MMRSVFLTFLLLITIHVFGAKKQVKLQIISTATQLADETTVYFDFGITPAFDSIQDAAKVFTANPDVPQLYTLSSDRVNCMINGYGEFNYTTSVAVEIQTNHTGNHIIATTLIDHFDPTTVIRLEDRTAGIFYDLRQGNHLFHLDSGVVANRFYLQLVVPAIITTSDAGCNNDDGTIQVAQDTAFRWSVCQLYDSNNVLRGSYTEITGNYLFTGLEQGDYTLAFTYNTYTAYKIVGVNGHQINVSINVADITTDVGQLIQFITDATNATDYIWNFGDSTIIEGVANPQISYTENGVYTVLLSCTNEHGCQGTATITIYVGVPSSVSEIFANSVQVFSYRNTITINSTTMGPLQYAVSNISGQAVATGSFTANNYIVHLSHSSPGPYLVTLSNGITTLTKRVLIQQ